jgi:hypothetical protein
MHHPGEMLVHTVKPGELFLCVLQSLVPGWWDAYSKHLLVHDRDPAPLKIGPFLLYISSHPHLFEESSRKINFVKPC